jgi:predicted DNA binding CopG/RHH family protein
MLLDEYERDIEVNFKKQVSNKENLSDIIKSAKQHLKNKQSITIRVAKRDIEAIKIKASKCGLPYQTYLNMLIHLDATKL